MNDFAIKCDFRKSLLGCEFVNMFEYPNQSKRKFIHCVWTKFHIEDQDGNISSLGSILLYPDDYSDPVPYEEWVKKINEQDVDMED